MPVLVVHRARRIDRPTGAVAAVLGHFIRIAPAILLSG